MKIVFLLILLFLPINIMCQLNLPKPEDIERIEFSKSNMANWYSSEELLKLLPNFIAVEGTYGERAIPFQYGKFILKNGKEINWMANYTESILLYEENKDGRKERLFVLPKKKKAIFHIWDKDGKEGFIDVNGNIVNKPINDLVGEFSEGLAPVMVGDKWGYMNEKDEIVIAPRWKNLNKGWLPPVSPFYEGLAVVIEEVSWDVINDSNYYSYKCGYINTKGEYVIQPKFHQRCGYFSNDLARIEVDWKGSEYEEGKGWIGFIDKQGNWAIKPQFYQAGNFWNGVALVQSENSPDDMYVKIPDTDNLVRVNDSRKSLYLIDKTGRKIETTNDCSLRHSYSEGLALIHATNDRKFFINEECKEVFQLSPDIKTDSFSYFSQGLILVYKEVAGKKVFGYLDKTGKTAIDFKFAKASPFSDGLAGVVIKEQDKEYNAYINQKGEIVLNNTRAIDPFRNGLAFHHLFTWTISERPDGRNIKGYMNKEGKYVWLSPRAEVYLDKDWIKENYIGAKLSEKK